MPDLRRRLDRAGTPRHTDTIGSNYPVMVISSYGDMVITDAEILIHHTLVGFTRAIFATKFDIPGYFGKCPLAANARGRGGPAPVRCQNLQIQLSELKICRLSHNLCIRISPNEDEDDGASGRCVRTGALNMPSTKKRARSPEVDGPLSTCQSTSVRIYQHVAPKKRYCRGPKDDCIKALRKLERKHRCEVFHDYAYKPIIARAHQLNTRVRHTAPGPLESPPQSSPGLVVPHSLPSLLVEDYDGGPESFNISPISPHVPSGSGLHMRTASGI